jgi:hypothetical protein
MNICEGLANHEHIKKRRAFIVYVPKPLLASPTKLQKTKEGKPVGLYTP